MKKRARLDIYRDILEVLKRQPEGVLITRLSYGAGLPIDRVKPMLDGLAHCELVVIRVRGDPLQSSLVQRRFYYITRKGLEFLEAYRKIQDLLTYLGTETGSVRKARPSAPIDFIGVTE